MIEFLGDESGSVMLPVDDVAREFLGQVVAGESVGVIPGKWEWRSPHFGGIIGPDGLVGDMSRFRLVWRFDFLKGSWVLERKGDLDG